MYIYNIPMKFRYACSGINYKEYSTELEKGQELYNLRASKMKRARKIAEIKYDTDGFEIILESRDELVNPSKALAVFSQELAKMDTLAEFKDSQNHLLCNNGQATEIEREEALFNDSTSEILKTVIDIFMNVSVSDSVFVASGRKDAQNKIIEVCREFKSLE
ncbi:MAG: hypothetical protein PUC65_12515 [Clostridiales bacterium]|nr:hypothetical protein [Clostridiales bacterium]